MSRSPERSEGDEAILRQDGIDCFAEFILSRMLRFFASFRMTEGEGLAMTGKNCAMIYAFNYSCPIYWAKPDESGNYVPLPSRERNFIRHYAVNYKSLPRYANIYVMKGWRLK